MLFLKKQIFFESIIARPVKNAITYNDVNVSEAVFIIKSTIMNIFDPSNVNFANRNARVIKFWSHDHIENII